MATEGESFAEKIRTIGTMGKHRGTTRDHVVLDEATGKRAGKHVEHWDGRQDAVVQIMEPRDRRRIRLGLRED